MSSDQDSANKRCAVCGAPFHCGAPDPGERCWCNDLPPLSPIVPGRGCLCRKCLEAELRPPQST